MIYEAVSQDRLKYNSHGTQKDILQTFNLTYHPRGCAYILNNEYVIIFLNSKSDSGWNNILDDNMNTIYESHESKDPKTIQLDQLRTLKRIIFYKDCNSLYGNGYSFIGMYLIDLNYNYKNDQYPSGKPMEPRLKYNRIATKIDTNDSISTYILNEYQNISFTDEQITNYNKNLFRGKTMNTEKSTNINQSNIDKTKIEQLLDKCYDTLSRQEFMLLLEIIKDEYK